nr:retrovirus-related Pol polyprotein from transposon TNT 1-94 [Tanacetum cinerariifolium]
MEGADYIYPKGTQMKGEDEMDFGFELTGFLDADYAGCKDTFKSTFGGAQFLGEKLVSWSSQKQDCTTLSTAKVEYVSLSACCAQVLWMRTQLTDYGFHFNKIPIYCDSKSAIAISCNPVQHSRTKHIAVRFHFIKEHVEKDTIELYFVKMDYQLANIFTKALPTDRFNYLVRRLGSVDLLLPCCLLCDVPALATRDVDRNTNGVDSHVSGTGTKGAIKLTQWFEKMETVFRISNCSVENQIKFSTCSLLGSALTWWNSYVTTVGPDAAYAMTWEAYKIERYVGGLPDVIHESVVASRPKTMQEAIEMAKELMDKRNNSWAERQNKRQNTGMAYTAGSGEKISYEGSKPLCLKCNYHHDGPCAPKCFKCNKVGHITHDCRGTTNVNTANNQRGNGTGQKPTCYECGSQGHFRKDCPKFKNNNHGTQGGHATTPAKVYAVGRAGTNPDSNVVT